MQQGTQGVKMIVTGQDLQNIADQVNAKFEQMDSKIKELEAKIAPKTTKTTKKT